MTTSDNGKVLLITGASTGIGRSTAIQAVEAGWRVVVAARSAEKLAALAAELGAERAMAVPCDVADWNQQEAMVQKTIGASAGSTRFSPMRVFLKGRHSSRVNTGPTSGATW